MKFWSIKEIPASTEAVILLLALVVYLICAVFSSGFYCPDEHFQILEFAKWKMEDNTPLAMPWEHTAMIRPSLQPVITMMIIRPCRWLGMQNPFHLVMLLRILTSLVMLYCMHVFVKAAVRWVNPEHKNGLLAATLFFWLIPLISVRFSSETLGVACLLLLLAGLLNQKQPSVREALWMGIIAALGFEFRYQMAFAYVGILVWILIVRQYRWQAWYVAALGFLGVLALCTALDCWFYGRLVFAPYNYYYMNIVMHMSTAYGKSPWYTYFLQLGVIPSLALGVPIILSVCIGTFKHYRNPVVWAFWAFLLIHSAFNHKEARYLLPLMPMLPLFLVWTYEIVLYKKNPIVSFIVIGLLTFVNMGGLIHVTFKPADFGRADMMQYLCKKASEERHLRVRANYRSNPFHTGVLFSHFYLWQPVNVEECDSISKEEESEFDMIVLQRKDSIEGKRLLAEGYREVYRSMPDWQNFLNRFYHTYDSDQVLIAYENK